MPSAVRPVPSKSGPPRSARRARAASGSAAPGSNAPARGGGRAEDGTAEDAEEGDEDADDDEDHDHDHEEEDADDDGQGSDAGSGVAGIEQDELEALKRDAAEELADDEAGGSGDGVGRKRRRAVGRGGSEAGGSGSGKGGAGAHADDEADQKSAAEEKERRRMDAAWRAFQSAEGDGTTRPASSTSKADADEVASSAHLGQVGSRASTTEAAEEMVLVKRRYRFAGEDIDKETLLPASHPDAIAYRERQQQKQQSLDASAREATGGTNLDPTSMAGASTSSSSSSAAAAPDRTTPLRRPSALGGPRRKRGGGLAALSAAATAKPVRLNTLEKSKLDWDSFKAGGGAKGSTSGANGQQPPLAPPPTLGGAPIPLVGGLDEGGQADDALTERERDEMEAQTRGGGSGLGSIKGYLARKEFLDGVHARLEQGRRR